MNNMLPTPYQQFIHKSRYARWIEDEGRREDWHETVYRYTNFMANHIKDKHDFDISKKDLSEIHDAYFRFRSYAKHEGNDDMWPCVRAR